jgi:predicted component of type VI protein secretion system
MPYIILSDRHAEIDRVELFDEVMTVGRSPECAVQVRDAMLSRQHCRLEPRADGRWALVDLESRNGTHLVIDDMTKAISRHLLEDGDVVQIGRSRLCFRAGSFVAAAPSDQQRRRVARPADPHEALAGTVTGFVLEPDMEEDSHLSGFPIPKPQFADPRAPRAQHGVAATTTTTTTAQLPLGTKRRATPHRPMPQPKIEPDEFGEESQALIDKPPLDWSVLPAPKRLGLDLEYMAVLASIFAAVAVFLTSICVISRGW